MSTLIEADYQQHRDAILAIREQVFIVEQGVPVELEVDELDPLSRHLLLFSHGQPIATGRLTPAGHIGRLAVLKPFRRCGFGGQLVQRLERIATEQGLPAVKLAAQIAAMPFYEKLGYQPEGKVFMDAGIAHRMMLKPLP